MNKKIHHQTLPSLIAHLDNQAVAQRLCWITCVDKLPRDKGVYILAMQLTHEVTINIGKLGAHTLLSGIYFYVGSARGGGGINSRVGRHWRNDKDKTKRWHIDYLRAPMQMLGCWVITDTDIKAPKLTETQTYKNITECDLAKLLAKHPHISKFGNIGSSDCHCLSHVFYLPSC